MLKITKGLKPFIEDVVSIYTDDKGDKYVRVKEGGEDFCIAPYDYSGVDGKVWFALSDAIKISTFKGMSIPSKNQITVYAEHIDEIDIKLNEIEGEPIKDDWYWTTTKRDDSSTWCYNGHSGKFEPCINIIPSRIRLIVSL